MSELLPCPFCGGEDLEIDHAQTYDVRHPDVYEVHCVECGGRGGEGWTEAEAITAWNTRAERTCRDANIGGSFVCSECGANVKDTYVGRSYVDKFGKRWYATSNGQAFNYCPNCGAKVVGE